MPLAGWRGRVWLRKSSDSSTLSNEEPRAMTGKAACLVDTPVSKSL